MQLIAIKPFTYGTRRLLPGMPFTASDRDARILVGIKKATTLPPVVIAENTSPQRKRRTKTVEDADGLLESKQI